MDLTLSCRIRQTFCFNPYGHVLPSGKHTSTWEQPPVCNNVNSWWSFGCPRRDSNAFPKTTDDDDPVTRFEELETHIPAEEAPDAEYAIN